MFLSCPLLTSHNAIRHGFFTRRGGKSSGLYTSLNCGYGSGDDISTVAENRALIEQALGAKPGSLCTVHQVHSPNVITMEKSWHWKEAKEADAMVTNIPGIALGILTADCLPILFSDNKKRVIGGAHAGWKGAFSGVIENTLDAMCALGAKRENITATIGPAIAQGSYEVGAEFYERFMLQDTKNSQYFIRGNRQGHYLYDLKTYAKDRLRASGVNQIGMLPDDTCLDAEDFFSFRRATLQGEKVYGRQISVMMLTE